MKCITFRRPTAQKLAITFSKFFSKFILAMLIAVLAELSSSIPVQDKARQAIYTSGDIVIGGLFPVHSGLEYHSATRNDHHSQHCKSLDQESGIQSIEAMMYAVDMINNSTSMRLNYTIGVNLRDTCTHEMHGLEESVHFIQSQGEGSDECLISSKEPPLFGVVGATASGVSMQVANLLRLFNTPLISYASTSPGLSDRKKYGNFFRTVPSDTYKVQAMIDVIRYFNWTSVFGIYSQNSYGTKGMEVFRKRMEASDICMVASFKVNSRTDFSTIIEKMNEFESTRVVVLFMSKLDLSNLLKAVKIKIMMADSSSSKAKYRFKWLASDTWGMKVNFIKNNQLEDAAEGAITFTQESLRVLGFENYFRNLTPETNRRNPWFAEFWEEYHNCSLTNETTTNTSLCTGKETLSKMKRFQSRVPYVIDAVHSFACAIYKLTKRHCTGTVCKLAKLKGQPLLNILIENFSFHGELGLLKFDRYGSTIRGYDINEFSAHPNVGYKKIGSWFQKLKYINAKTRVQSSCSDICKVGQIMVPKKAGVSCCFKCRDCGGNQFVKDDKTCKFCKRSEMPNASRTGCQEIPEVHVSFLGAIVTMILTVCGIAATFLVIILFVYHNNTAIVRASGRELSYPLLFGVILCYTFPYIWLAEPTEMSCGIKRFTTGIGFFICYAALLIKTIRIERIFKNKTSILSSKGTFLKPSSQVLIYVIAVLIMALLTLLGLFMEPPSIAIIVDKAKLQKMKWCNFPFYDRLLVYTSNILSIILCTIFAFRTRKVPDCFNEAKYIGFVMYTTCFLWIAFGTLRVGLPLSQQLLSQCMITYLSAASILLGIFGPKVYIILFRPERNNRSLCGFPKRGNTSKNETCSANVADRHREMKGFTDSSTQTDVGSLVADF